MPKRQLWSQMAFTGAPRLVLHVLCSTLTSGGLLSPLNSILAFFLPFLATFLIRQFFQNQFSQKSSNSNNPILILGL